MNKPQKIHDVLRAALSPRERIYRPEAGAFEASDTAETIRRMNSGSMQDLDSHPSNYRNDPIFTPLFTALLGSGYFTLFGSTIYYASIASAIATTAVTMGVQRK